MEILSARHYFLLDMNQNTVFDCVTDNEEIAIGFLLLKYPKGKPYEICVLDENDNLCHVQGERVHE